MKICIVGDGTVLEGAMACCDVGTIDIAKVVPQVKAYEIRVPLVQDDCKFLYDDETSEHRPPNNRSNKHHNNVLAFNKKSRR